MNVLEENTTEPRDEELARQVQGGEPRAFGILVERYEEKLRRYARKFLLDPDDAKDLVQNVFIKAYTNIKSFDLGRRFSPWIYRIAHNEFINAIRKREGGGVVYLFDFDTVLPHLISNERADGELDRKEMADILEKGLDKIDSKYREPLVLYFFEEMNYSEISDVLGIPVSTVGVRLNRAKAMLKKNIKKENI